MNLDIIASSLPNFMKIALIWRVKKSKK